jgi:hypothetical protein
VRASHSSGPAEERKSRLPASPENHTAVPDAPPRFVPPDPAEKARRVAELRAALAGSAPASQARARRGEGGARS